MLIFRRRRSISHPQSADNRYDVLLELGRVGGGFNAGIAVVKRKSDRLICIRKRLVPGQLSTPRHWNREADIMRKLRGHRNICSFIEANIAPGRAELYLEYCKMGTVHDFMLYMKNRRLVVPEGFVWHLLHDLTSALGWMHDGFARPDDMLNSATKRVQGWMPVIHRDIKPDNCFLQTQTCPYNPYPIVKLGDFGLAINKVDISSLSNTSRGVCAPGWFPPEYPLCGERSDVYRTAAIAQLLCLPHWALGIGTQISSHYSQGLSGCIQAGMQRNINERPFARDFYRFIDHLDDANRALVPVPNDAFKVLQL
ncbi:NEK protein kinase [[Emmonsia] crescens]|uniref:non-specific serine/threonine protein kinase n=1 Tax=[Emmonsia] crescens TaxID=73230 RepID=A0A2B7ZLA2_9EURO|nr:NEK protein kinase [Emmonsia crescens]